MTPTEVLSAAQSFVDQNLKSLAQNLIDRKNGVILGEMSPIRRLAQMLRPIEMHLCFRLAESMVETACLKKVAEGACDEKK